MKKNITALLLLATSIAFAQDIETAKLVPNDATEITAITGTPKQKQNYFWNTTKAKWDTTNVNSYTYDVSQRITVDLSKSYAAGTFNNNSKTNYYYFSGNTSGYMDSLAQYVWNGGLWEKQAKGIYQYQNQSKGWLKHGELYFGTTLFLVVDQFYGSNTFLKYSIQKQVDFTSGQLAKSDSSVYTTDGVGNTTAQTSHKWNKGKNKYEKSQYTTNTYDVNNNPTLSTVQKWDTISNSFVNDRQTSTTYNSYKNPTVVLQKTWNKTSNAWVDFTRTSTFYKNNTEYDYQLVEKYTTAWVNQNKYVWGNTTLSIPFTTLDANLYIYPNPANDILNIGYTAANPFSGTMKVIDVSGKEVMATTAIAGNTGLQTTTINTSNLSQGVYFIQLQIDNTIISRKFVK